MRGSLGEQPVDGRLEDLVGDSADVLEPDATLAIEEECFGHSVDPVVHGDRSFQILGDFARDGSQATIKLQVNRLVSWIWIGGVVLTLGALLAILPERHKSA